jgi:hypothetical protein
LWCGEFDEEVGIRNVIVVKLFVPRLEIGRHGEPARV